MVLAKSAAWQPSHDSSPPYCPSAVRARPSSYSSRVGSGFGRDGVAIRRSGELMGNPPILRTRGRADEKASWGILVGPSA